MNSAENCMGFFNFVYGLGTEASMPSTILSKAVNPQPACSNNNRLAYQRVQQLELAARLVQVQ